MVSDYITEAKSLELKENLGYYMATIIVNNNVSKQYQPLHESWSLFTFFHLFNIKSSKVIDLSIFSLEWLIMEKKKTFKSSGMTKI